MLTTDTRRQPLVFKASVYELSVTLLLVEFRRSKVSHLLSGRQETNCIRGHVSQILKILQGIGYKLALQVPIVGNFWGSNCHG